jgi:hypothetical protein
LRAAGKRFSAARDSDSRPHLHAMRELADSGNTVQMCGEARNCIRSYPMETGESFEFIANFFSDFDLNVVKLLFLALVFNPHGAS